MLGEGWLLQFPGGQILGKFARSKFAWACTLEWVPAKRSGRFGCVDWWRLAWDVGRGALIKLERDQGVGPTASFVCKTFEEARDLLIPQQNTLDNIASSRIQTAKPVSSRQSVFSLSFFGAHVMINNLF